MSSSSPFNRRQIADLIIAEPLPAAGQMGMVAKLFQKYGNDIEKYPGHEIKYTLGLILFNSLWT